MLKEPAQPEVSTPRDKNFQRREDPEDMSVLMLKLDSRAKFEFQQLQPKGGMVTVHNWDQLSKTVRIGATLLPNLRNKVRWYPYKKFDLFVWSPCEMAGVNPEICCHKLALNLELSSLQKR